MRDENVLAMVLAGGEGTRLSPLTAARSKPAVPFGGRYRIVDFVLSNLVNSGIHSIYVLVQYRSQSLIEHIRAGWVLAPMLPHHFVTVVPPQMIEGPQWFQGTADAIHQNLNLIRESGATLIAVFGADHIYRMDLRQMIEAHRANDADVSIAAVPVRCEDARGFGVMGCAVDGRIRQWVEKPQDPPQMPDRPGYAYASTGNYLFDTDVLIEALIAARNRGERDFGRDVIPALMNTHRVYAYDFSANRVPGVRDYEEPGYWRDVGTLDAYFAATMDTLGAQPRIQLFNRQWPIRSSNYQGPPTHMADARVENSHLTTGGQYGRCTIRNSVIRREVSIADDVLIEDSIIMDYCVIARGARIRRAIIDRYNYIGPGERIGYDRAADAARYRVTESGLVALPMAENVLRDAYE